MNDDKKCKHQDLRVSAMAGHDAYHADAFQVMLECPQCGTKYSGTVASYVGYSHFEFPIEK